MPLALLSLVAAGVAAAHEEHALDAGRLPSADAWNAVTALSLVLLAIWYVFGLRRLWAHRAGRAVIPVWRVLAFGAGVAATAIALLSTLDRSSDTLFSAHMVQHEILILVSAPLMVFGRPFIAAVWALGPPFRRVVVRILRDPWLARLWQRLSGPFTVLLLHAVVLWGWHLPWMFELALHHEGIHVIQHLSFFLTAALFWWALIHGRYGRIGYGAGILYVFGTALHSEVLSALLTFDSRPLYATHALRTAAHGLEPIADQQLAGVLMWVPFGAVFVVIGLSLFAAWLGEAERRVTANECRRAASLAGDKTFRLG
ncbi:MAG TPA: cytochrome c oxidase assembly protein [Thermoanaerobaculia bacterium]|nr:cytochrome c oxidase assembly protein [Thermoanaerobaculia bacterium]